jgi:hypothetical protein
MKQKHILNIGMAKCGTSWLWKQLGQHPDVCLETLEKEPPYFLENNNFDEYKKYYQNLDISANFHVATWQVDQCLIQQLDQVATHTTIMISSPYLFIERFYNWLPKTLEIPDFVDMCIDTKQICYSDIVNRWIKNLSKSKFKILFYEDIVSEPAQFLSDYFKFCELRNVKITGIETKVNENQQPKTPVLFSSSQIKLINLEIEKFQSMVERNLTHWQKR